MTLKYLKAALVSFCLVISSFANSTLINNLDEHNGSGLYTNNPSESWSRGWAFNVNADDLWVSQLGLHTPENNNSNFTISLWNLSTQTLLTSTAASDTSNTWSWFDIAPLELFNGEQYLISLHGINSSYYFGKDSDLRVSGDIEYVQTQYCNNCDNDELPTTELAKYSYGLVDFAYQVGEPQGYSTVSEPSSMAILALAMFSLASRRFKK